MTTIENNTIVMEHKTNFLFPIYFSDCGKGYACIESLNPSRRSHYLTTLVDYYPTSDHNLPLLLRHATGLSYINSRPQYKWKFKCLNCTHSNYCQLIFKQQRWLESKNYAASFINYFNDDDIYIYTYLISIILK